MGGEEAEEGRKGGGRREVPERVKEDDVCVRLLGGRNGGEMVFRRVLDPADTRTEVRRGQLGL